MKEVFEFYKIECFSFYKKSHFYLSTFILKIQFFDTFTDDFSYFCMFTYYFEILIDFLK
jgi:hypothetical protein